MDNNQLEQSKEPGQPFLIPTGDGQVIKAFQNRSFGNIIPGLIINDQVIQIVEKLKWYEYTLAILPLLLCFIGGILGGLFGGPGAYLVLHIFMKEQNRRVKYLKAAAVVLVTYILYFLAAFILIKLIN